MRNTALRGNNGIYRLVARREVMAIYARLEIWRQEKW